MARVLLIDDDEALLEVLTLAFSDAGHVVTAARDGQEGLQKLADGSGGADVVVSDINMPRLDGFTLCRRLREQGNAIPLILLTSRDNEIDEALGLDLGADDYISKPFSTRVLLARVAALLRRDAARREAEPAAESSGVRVGDLLLDPTRLLVRWRDCPVEVTVTEFKLLEALTSRPGVVFSRDRLIDIIRGQDVIVTDRVIDTYVRRLRRKLEGVDAAFAAIETVVGAGYRWRR